MREDAVVNGSVNLLELLRKQAPGGDLDSCVKQSRCSPRR